LPTTTFSKLGTLIPRTQCCFLKLVQITTPPVFRVITGSYFNALGAFQIRHSTLDRRKRNAEVGSDGFVRREAQTIAIGAVTKIDINSFCA